jgi:hypothetical protein
MVFDVEKGVEVLDILRRTIESATGLGLLILFFRIHTYFSSHP